MSYHNPVREKKLSFSAEMDDDQSISDGPMSWGTKFDDCGVAEDDLDLSECCNDVGIISEKSDDTEAAASLTAAFYPVDFPDFYQVEELDPRPCNPLLRPHSQNVSDITRHMMCSSLATDDDDDAAFLPRPSPPSPFSVRPSLGRARNRFGPSPINKS